MPLSEEEMWKALVDCSKDYDGKFYYAVRTVGVYCRPSCKSKTPLRKNVAYFESQRAAEESGYRPCKRCRPDLFEYAPAKELAEQTKVLIDDYYKEKDRLTSEMNKLGVSANHMALIFKQQYGLTPSQYLNNTRGYYAMKMLAETNLPIIDIAGELGFDTLSSFYRFFKKQTGTTPREFRNQRSKLHPIVAHSDSPKNRTTIK